MEDAKIIALFWARKEQAVRETDLAYGRRLFALSHRILDVREDAQECVNDTYLEVWQSIPPQKPKFFYGFLAAICRNLSLNRVDWNLAARRNAQVVELTQEMESCIPDRRQEQEFDRQEVRNTLERFLEALSGESRLIFLRRYLFADSVAQIAARYHLSESKVKPQLHRTRKKLYVYLKKEGICV